MKVNENITPFERLAANFGSKLCWTEILQGCEQLKRENNPLGIELTSAIYRIHDYGNRPIDIAVIGVINGWRVKDGFYLADTFRRQSPTYKETDYTPIVEAVKRLKDQEMAAKEARASKRRAAKIRREGGYTRLYIHPDTIEAVNKLLSDGKLVVTDGILSLSI